MNLCKDCKYYLAYSLDYRFDECTNISAMVSVDEVTGYTSYKSCHQMRGTKCKYGALFKPTRLYKLKQLVTRSKS